MRFAVIGRNFITDRFLAAAKFCADFTLEAVYSRDALMAQAYAQVHGAPLWFDSLEELAGCTRVDAVYIASPNSLHAPQAIRLLLAGKHVLCEKPVASNLPEYERMLDAAKQGGVLLLEAMRPVFAPGFAVIRDLLPRLGPIRHVSLHFCQYSSRYDRFQAGVVENAFNPALSNSGLMDLGVYCVHPLVALFGLPERLSAANLTLANGFDGAGTILAEYPGMLAELGYSKLSDSCCPSEIQGERGSLLLGRVSSPQEVTFWPRGGKPEALPIERDEHDMRYELEAFLRFTAEPALAEPYQRWSRQTLTVMDEARRLMGVRFPADEPAGAENGREGEL